METKRNKVGEFCSILDRMAETYKKKNEDYGDAFAKQIPVDGWGYATGILGGKLDRIRHLLLHTPDHTPLIGESVGDNLLDLANYSIMTLMEFEAMQAERAAETIVLEGTKVMMAIKELTDEELDEIGESCEK